MRVGTVARRRALMGWGAVCLVALALGAGSATGPADAQTPPVPATSAYERGGLIYAQQCAQCHGASGAGGPVAGGGRAPSLLAAENPEVTVAYVDLVTSTGRMPPAGSPFDNRDRRVVLGDPEERAALITWMSREFGTDGELPEVGAGDATRGLEIWTANCSHCHGATGAGGVAGAGTWTPQVNTRTPLEIAEAIRVGPFQMPRFEPEQISDQGLADVAAFLTAIEGEERTPLFGLLELNPVYAAGFVAGIAVLMLILLLWIAGRPAAFPDPPKTPEPAGKQP